jgi:Ca-activated chloride channel family protein
LVELPFPNTVEVIDRLLFSYLDEQRVPAHAIFVLDVSGSMRGDGLDDLQQAIKNLTGQDESLTGRFARFRSREKITLLTFSSGVNDSTDFLINDTSSQGADMQTIRSYVDGLNANGGTAIYTALAEAYRLAESAQAQDPNRYYTIVLMSDGEKTEGISQRQFEQAYQALSPQAQNVRTFTVLFGKADEREMSEIAEITGGRMFDGRSLSLSAIFKQIRGYQ